MFECDLAHRRSVSVLCMLYKIRCTPLHPLYGALPVPYVPVWFTRGAVIDIGTLMRLLAADPRSIARLLFQFLISLWNDLSDPYPILWDWLVSRERPMHFNWPSSSLPFVCSCFSFLFSIIFGNMFHENHGFVAEPVTILNNFVSLYWLDKDKLEHVFDATCDLRSNEDVILRKQHPNINTWHPWAPGAQGAPRHMFW